MKLRPVGLRALQASITKYKGQGLRDMRSQGRAAVMASRHMIAKLFPTTEVLKEKKKVFYQPTLFCNLHQLLVKITGDPGSNLRGVTRPI